MKTLPFNWPTHQRRFTLIHSPINGIMAFHIVTGTDDIWVPSTAMWLERNVEDYLKVNHRAVAISQMKLVRKLGHGVDYEVIAEVYAPSDATFKTIDEIKAAVDKGKLVFWKTQGYEVVKDKFDNYFIIFQPNKHCIGLTNMDGNLLNGNIEDFFLGEEVRDAS